MMDPDYLTADGLRAVLDYDPETGLFRWRNGTKFAGKLAGSPGRKGYVQIGIGIGYGGGSYAAHRLAWLYMTGHWPASQIDHKNGITDDNRFSNLREATRSQNKQNCGRYKINSSGYKGVRFYPLRGKWLATISNGGRRFHLGYFHTAEEAYTAYCTAARELHGEFARVV